jgi:hypothetical protein
MKKTASTEAAGFRIDGAQDEKKEILFETGRFSRFWEINHILYRGRRINVNSLLSGR